MKLHSNLTVLFDMDGTLVDSEPNWWEGDRRFVELFGGTYDEPLRNECIGMGAKNFVVLIKGKYGLPQGVEELLEIKDKMYLEAAAGRTHAFPEMLALVKFLSAQKVPMAVASGSSVPIIEMTLREAGLRPYFGDHVYSSDQVARGKPFPDVFLHAAKQLGADPAHCLVFEDSFPGVQAAMAAGMKVCAVPQVWTEKSRPTFEKADLVFQNMSEFTATAVLNWIEVSLS